MTDSPVNSSWVAAISLLCLVSAGPIAHAQQTAPVTEIKIKQSPPSTGAASKPRMLSAPKRKSTAKKTPRRAPIAVTGGGVQVDNLAAIDVNEAGILVPSSGALGIDMWRGTSAALVARMLPELPVNSPSSTMQDLLRRLLLSPARAPQSTAIPDPNPTQLPTDVNVGGSLISKRLKVLVETGDFEGANELLRSLPDVKRDPELNRLDADIGFYTHDLKRACALAEREISIQSTAYWQKAFNFCQIVNGEAERAALGLSLMRELGLGDDVFFALAEALIAKEPLVLTSLPDPTALHLAMMREANAKFPSDIPGAVSPAVSRTIATSPLTSQEIRLDAAERADTAGALPKATLRQLYASVDFSEADRANPLSRAEVEFGPMVRALLYHTALTQTVPTAKAEATSRAFSLARDEGRYASTVQVFEPVLHRIPPSAELKWFAPQAVRAFLVIGDRARAKGWYQIIQSSAGLNADSRRALEKFKPIAWLFEFEDQNMRSDKMITDWSKAHENDPDVSEKAALLFNVLEALGLNIPENAWSPYITAARRSAVSLPSSGVWRRIVALANGDAKATTSSSPVLPPTSLKTPSLEAVQVGRNRSPQVITSVLEQPGGRPVRVGETVMLSLIAIGNAGPATIDPFVLNQVIKALGQAGLTQEARALALDAVLAKGL